MAFALYSAAAFGGYADAKVMQLREENSQLQQSIDRTTEEISQAGSDSWLEEQARLLGFVLPGERVFIVNPGGPASGGGGISFAPPTFAPPNNATPTPTPAPSATPHIFVLPSPPPPNH